MVTQNISPLHWFPRCGTVLDGEWICDYCGDCWDDEKPATPNEPEPKPVPQLHDWRPEAEEVYRLQSLEDVYASHPGELDVSWKHDFSRAG